MNGIKMVASDLDGTLLMKGGLLSDENLRAISALTENGIAFVPVTGRSLCEIPRALREHPDIRYFICSGGAVIYDKLERRTSVCGLSAEQNDFVTSVFSKRYYWPIYHYGNRVYLDRAKFDAMEGVLVAGGAYNDGLLSVWKEGRLEDFEGFFRGKDGIEMVTVVFESEKEQLAVVSEIREKMPELVISLNTFHNLNNLELVAPGADKGTALKALCKELSLAQSDVLVMGDSENDMKMFLAFENSVAVANANPRLISVAAYKACKNSEHALEYTVKNLIGLK